MTEDVTYATLRDRFGDRFSTGHAVREQHGRGESHHAPSMPDAVVWPLSTEEVSEIMRFCHAERIPVVPFGGGTSLEGNVLATRGGLCIDLSRMTGILRVSEQDLDATIEPGVTRQQLDAFLRDKGLFFAVDPGAEATIGGMAATRASGTNAVRYGTMRENVLSLKVVLADGRVITTARRARKSSAGYDLTRLFIGSEGTLGIITELTVKLHGIPEAVQAVVCRFPDVGSAVDTAISMIQLGLPVAKIELLDDALMAAVNRYAGLDEAVADTLFVEFQGSPGAVEEQTALLREIAADNGGVGFRWASDADERRRLWKARHEGYYATVALRPGARGWATDVCVPVSNLAQCIVAAKTLLRDCSVPATVMGHVGDGNFHIVFAVDPESESERAELAVLNAKLVELALRLDGTCTGEHGIGVGKLGYMYAEHGDAVDVMRLIKNALDPADLLNPGKVIPAARA